ncbi:MAG: ATP-binding protein, partial [Pseudomonadota bacterium]
EERVAERTAELSDLNLALEDARAQAEAATASKTSFLAAASHDVLQPLNAARLFASALAEEIDEGGPGRELVNKIAASISSADGLLRALLNVSKLDAGGIEPEFAVFSLSDLFEELEREFSVIAEDSGLKLRVRSLDILIRSDRGLLRSALQNLLSNAIRYTDKGGVLLACRRCGETARLEVYDTGRGIPDDKAQEIFVEFRRLRRDADQSGAGLGLAIVQRITRLLDQPVTVASVLGRGTRFTIEAPIAESAPPIRLRSSAAVSLPSPTGRLLTGKTVLCLDNDRQILDALDALLVRWGARALTARDEAEARLATPEPPDLVLLDYRLDRGATGVGVYEALCAQWGAQPPAILITASQSEGFQSDAERIGAPVIAKPVEPAALRALIAQMLRAAAE